MKGYRILRFGALAALVVWASGCASYRMNCPAPNNNSRFSEGTDETPPHGVAVVEFDDQGEFWDIAQLRAAVGHIRAAGETNDQGIVTIIFVHGWHQQARWNKGRLPWFMNQIRAAAHESARYAAEEGGPPAPVIGVYLGWRGEVFDAPVLKHFDFWNRLLASRRVASIDMTEALASLVEATGNHPQSQCILIGHSMGAAILERVLEPFIANQLVSNEELVADGTLDLVVFANPSIEALYTKQLIDLLRRRGVRLVKELEDGTRVPADGPLFVTLSAEDDTASRIIFPAGQWFASWFTKFRDYDDPASPSQKYLMKRTAPHTCLLSHVIEDRGEDGFAIQRHPESCNDTPFWVVRVPKTVMSHHGDLESERFGDILNWLTGLNDLKNPGTRLILEQDLESALVEEEEARTAREARKAELLQPVPLK